MEEYKPNSHRFKAEQKAAAEDRKVEKVVSGKTKTKKKSELSKFADVFISEDVNNVKSYVLMDVLVPAVKKAISDIVTNGIDMILYGESGRRSKNTSASYVSYRSYSDSRREEPRYSERAKAGNRPVFEDIVFETRGDAEAVRTAMEDSIAQYGVVTVGDMYDFADITPPFTSNRYGWTSLRTAEVVRAGGGYVIKLPKAMAIER